MVCWQQAITYKIVDLKLCRHMASLCRNELITVKSYIHFIAKIYWDIGIPKMVIYSIIRFHFLMSGNIQRNIGRAVYHWWWCYHQTSVITSFVYCRLHLNWSLIDYQYGNVRQIGQWGHDIWVMAFWTAKLVNVNTIAWYHFYDPLLTIAVT